MKITYDKEIDAMYIYFKKGKVAKTLSVGADFITDVDAKGNIIGLEILNASHHIDGKREHSRISIGNKSFSLASLGK